MFGVTFDENTSPRSPNVDDADDDDNNRATAPELALIPLTSFNRSRFELIAFEINLCRTAAAAAATTVDDNRNGTLSTNGEVRSDRPSVSRAFRWKKAFSPSSAAAMTLVETYCAVAAKRPPIGVI